MLWEAISKNGRGYFEVNLHIYMDMDSVMDTQGIKLYKEELIKL